MLNPDMPADQMRLMAGEMTAQEIRVARAFIRAANAKAQIPMTEDNIILIQNVIATASWQGREKQAEAVINECNKIIRGE